MTEAAHSVSDEHSQSEDPKGLSGEAMPARSAQAETPLPPPLITEGEIGDLASRLRKSAQCIAYGSQLAKDLEQTAQLLLTLSQQVKSLTEERDSARASNRVYADAVLSLNRKRDEAIARAEASQAQCVSLRRALAEANTALHDWLHTYADDLCREEDVAAAKARIRENGGTLAYLSRVFATIRSALSAQEGGEK